MAPNQTPGRCTDCKWAHEADSVKGTSFMGVDLCPLHAAAGDLLAALSAIARLKPYGDGPEDCPPDGDDAMRVLNYHIKEAREITAGLNGPVPMTEAEEERRGLLLAAAVGLKARASKEYTGKRYELREGWGTKTALGLYRTVASIIKGAK